MNNQSVMASHSAQELSTKQENEYANAQKRGFCESFESYIAYRDFT